MGQPVHQQANSKGASTQYCARLLYRCNWKSTKPSVRLTNSALKTQPAANIRRCLFSTYQMFKYQHANAHKAMPHHANKVHGICQPLMMYTASSTWWRTDSMPQRCSTRSQIQCLQKGPGCDQHVQCTVMSRC